MDKTLKRQVVMVDKDFEKITYEDNNANVKGTFETFKFESDGSSAPFNEGYGQNLTVMRETRKEKIPNMGFRSPLKIEQDKESGDAYVRIAFTTLQTRHDQYGMLLAIRFLNNTDKAVESYSAYTSEMNIATLQSIKTLGGLTVNGNTYEYFLVKVAADSSNRTSTTVQLNFYAGLLTNGKMSMEIYEGFTFNNFSDSDYGRANLTTYTPYPHQKDFDKHKFRDVMNGNVLLAGTKLGDGTVKADKTLRLTVDNLGTPLIKQIIRHHMTMVLPFTGLDVAQWSIFQYGGGYPGPILPLYGTGKITVRLLAHYFDNDASIPAGHLTIGHRIVEYKESSKVFHPHTNISYTNEDGVSPAVKRNGHVSSTRTVHDRQNHALST